MNPVVLVGRRPDGGHRDRLWAHCERWWHDEVGWPVCVGYHHGPRPFSLAAASNQAAFVLDDWDVALYAGADILLGSPAQALNAATRALDLGQLVFAHDHYYALSEEGTGRVLVGERPHGLMSDLPPWPNTFSSALAVPRILWDAVGGFDERFVGWGWEDWAFLSACNALGGGYQRVTGPVFHLWHERVWEEREGAGPSYNANQVLGERYMAAKSSPERMRLILEER